MSRSELEVGGSRSVVAVPFYPDLAFLAWVAPGRSPARQSSHLSSHSLSHSSACLSAAAAGNSDLAQNGFRVRWCYCWGIFHFACSPWFITPPGLTQKWLYLFNLCLFVRLFIWIKPMILIFFFLLFKTIVEREVKYPASGVGFGLKPWAGQTSGVLSLFFFVWWCHALTAWWCPAENDVLKVPRFLRHRRHVCCCLHLGMLWAYTFCLPNFPVWQLEWSGWRDYI